MNSDLEIQMYEFRDAWDTELIGPYDSPGYSLLRQQMQRYREQGKTRTQSAILIMNDLAQEIDKLHNSRK